MPHGRDPVAFSANTKTCCVTESLIPCEVERQPDPTPCPRHLRSRGCVGAKSLDRQSSRCDMGDATSARALDPRMASDPGELPTAADTVSRGGRSPRET